MKKTTALSVIFCEILAAVLSPTVSTAQASRSENLDERTMTQSVYRTSARVLDGKGRASVAPGRIVEIGPGVNYNVVAPGQAAQWRPARAELRPSTEPGMAYECRTNPMACQMPTLADTGFRVTPPDGSTVTLSVAGATASFHTIESEYSLLYAEALSGMDLRAISRKGSFAVHGIFKNLQSIRPLCITLQTDLQPADEKYRSGQAGGIEVAGGLLLGRETAGKWNSSVYLVKPFAFDATNKPIAVKTHLTGMAGGLSLNYEIDQEDLKDVEFPVTLDPELVLVSTKTLDRFEHGVTYLVAGYYVIDRASPVTFEGGAIVKFLDSLDGWGSGIIFTGNVPEVTVAGEPHNYVYFTSAYDDSVGYDTDKGLDPKNPQGQTDRLPGCADYQYALYFDGTQSSRTYLIDHAKFRYAFCPVSCTASSPNTVLAVCSSVFRDCYGQTCFYAGASGGSGSLAFVNNLAVNHSCTGPGVDFRPASSGDWNLYVFNNTFDLLRGSVFVYPANPVNDFVVMNNIFYIPQSVGHSVHIYPHIAFNAGSSPVRRLTNNMTMWYDSYYYVNGYSSGNCPPQRYETYNPSNLFTANDNGSYYLSTTGLYTRDAGTTLTAAEWASCLDINNDTQRLNVGRLFYPRRTTTWAASGRRVIDNDITASRYWTPIDRDDGTVDLGYHYDPVDYIVRGKIVNGQFTDHVRVTGSDTVLTISPGVTVGYSDLVSNGGLHAYTSNSLEITNDATLDVQGGGVRQIWFTSTLLAGDRVGNDDAVAQVSGVPRVGCGPLYGHALVLGGSDKSVVRFAGFSGATSGIFVRAPIAGPIEDCRFIDNASGVLTDFDAILTGDHEVNIHNCLFLCNSACAADLDFSDYAGSSVSNCTFARNVLGLRLNTSTFGENGQMVANCIFTSNTTALSGATGSSDPDAIRNNRFWDNTTHVATGTTYSVSENLMNVNPLLAASADPYFTDNNPVALNRYHLASNSPCIDAGLRQIGSRTVYPYMASALSAQTTVPDSQNLDFDAVDIGYHYPVPGSIGVSRNGFYFVREDNEPFIVLGINCAPYRQHDPNPQPFPWTSIYAAAIPCGGGLDCGGLPTLSELDAYLAQLKDSGINTIRHFTEFLSNECTNFSPATRGYGLALEINPTTDPNAVPPYIDPDESAGKINQPIQACNDTIVEMARQHGLYVLLELFDACYVSYFTELGLGATSPRICHWDIRHYGQEWYRDPTTYQQYWKYDLPLSHAYNAYRCQPYLYEGPIDCDTGSSQPRCLPGNTCTSFTEALLDERPPGPAHLREELFHDDTIPWSETAANTQQAMLNRWKYLMHRYGRTPNLFGFDLMNEINILLEGDPTTATISADPSRPYPMHGGYTVPTEAEAIAREAWFLCGKTSDTTMTEEFDGMGMLAKAQFQGETGRPGMQSVSHTGKYWKPPVGAADARLPMIFDTETEGDDPKPIGCDWIDHHLYPDGSYNSAYDPIISYPEIAKRIDSRRIADAASFAVQQYLAGYLNYQAYGEWTRTPPPLLNSEWNALGTWVKIGAVDDPFQGIYYRHGAWAHLAAGGAGNMYWAPNMISKMSDDQLSAARVLSRFANSLRVPFSSFQPQTMTITLNDDVPSAFSAYGCTDGHHALVYLIRKDYSWDGVTTNGYHLDSNKYKPTLNRPVSSIAQFHATIGSSAAFDSTQSYRADLWDPGTPPADGPILTTDDIVPYDDDGLQLTVPAGIFVAQGRLDLFLHIYPYD